MALVHLLEKSDVQLASSVLHQDVVSSEASFALNTGAVKKLLSVVGSRAVYIALSDIGVNPKATSGECPPVCFQGISSTTV